ncbi:MULTISPECIES: DUF1275 family protein [Paraburkholderia]|uniref:DUF1275 family protein n=1 Tax=Paraburkholderia unamae TaxID=219649 RepID=A0ACC6RG13_9BURK
MRGCGHVGDIEASRISPEEARVRIAAIAKAAPAPTWLFALAAAAGATALAIIFGIQHLPATLVIFVSAGIGALLRRALVRAVDATLLSIEERLPPILSVIAGMVDLTGFFMLGNIFTAHVTGNLVIASAVAVRGGPIHAVQLPAIPVFVVSLALVWLVARLSDRTAPSLVRLLLLVQFLLIAKVFAICVAAAPSSHPHSVLAYRSWTCCRAGTH